MKQRKLICSLAVLMIALLLSGFSCNNTRVATASRNAAATVKAFQKAEMSLHNQGKISESEHRQIQRYIKGVAISGMTVDQCVKQQAAISCIDGALVTVNDLLVQGVIPIKDEQTRQELQLAVELIKTTFNTLKALL